MKLKHGEKIPLTRANARRRPMDTTTERQRCKTELQKNHPPESGTGNSLFFRNPKGKVSQLNKRLEKRLALKFLKHSTLLRLPCSMQKEERSGKLIQNSIKEFRLDLCSKLKRAGSRRRLTRGDSSPPHFHLLAVNRVFNKESCQPIMVKN